MQKLRILSIDFYRIMRDVNAAGLSVANNNIVREFGITAFGICDFEHSLAHSPTPFRVSVNRAAKVVFFFDITK